MSAAAAPHRGGSGGGATPWLSRSSSVAAATAADDASVVSEFVAFDCILTNPASFSDSLSQWVPPAIPALGLGPLSSLLAPAAGESPLGPRGSLPDPLLLGDVSGEEEGLCPVASLISLVYAVAVYSIGMSPDGETRP